MEDWCSPLLSLFHACKSIISLFVICSQTGVAAWETEAKDAYNNYQQDDQGGNLNTGEFAQQEYKDFTQPQV